MVRRPPWSSLHGRIQRLKTVEVERGKVLPDESHWVSVRNQAFDRALPSDLGGPIRYFELGHRAAPQDRFDGSRGRCSNL